MSNKKILDDGTEIDKQTFGAIFGGGQKKALDTPRHLRLGDGAIFEFTIRDMASLQELIDTYQTEHDRISAENDRLKRQIAAMRGEDTAVSTEGVIKRKRGRPRKHPIIPAGAVVSLKPRIRVSAVSERIAA